MFKFWTAVVLVLCLSGFMLIDARPPAAAGDGYAIGLVVSDSGTPYSEDATLKSTLENDLAKAHTVTYIDDDNITASTACDSYDICWVSDSITPGKADELDTSATSLIIGEPTNVDEFSVATAELNSPISETQIDVLDDSTMDIGLTCATSCPEAFTVMSSTSIDRTVTANLCGTLNVDHYLIGEDPGTARLFIAAYPTAGTACDSRAGGFEGARVINYFWGAHIDNQTSTDVDDIINGVIEWAYAN